MAITVCLMFRISFKAGWWYHLQKMSGIAQVEMEPMLETSQIQYVIGNIIPIHDILYWLLIYGIFHILSHISHQYYILIYGEWWTVNIIIQNYSIQLYIHNYNYIYKQPTISLLVVRTVNKNMCWLWTSNFCCGSPYFLIANPMCCA